MHRESWRYGAARRVPADHSLPTMYNLRRVHELTTSDEAHQVVAVALVARALVPAELEEAVAVGAIGLEIAGGLLHREAGHHDGRDAVGLGDRVEHGEVLLARRERRVARAEVVGELDVDELVHGHVRRGRSAALQLSQSSAPLGPEDAVTAAVGLFGLHLGSWTLTVPPDWVAPLLLLLEERLDDGRTAG